VVQLVPPDNTDPRHAVTSAWTPGMRVGLPAAIQIKQTAITVRMNLVCRFAIGSSGVFDGGHREIVGRPVRTTLRLLSLLRGLTFAKLAEERARIRIERRPGWRTSHRQ
jgi:hypothetical protein